MKADLTETERKLASDLLCFLIEKLSIERLDVFKYNLDIIKLIVEAWKSVLKVPTHVVTSYIASNDKCVIGIHLASVFLVNNLKVWNDNGIESFIDLLIKKLNSNSKAVTKPCAETIGLFLKNVDNETYTSKVDGYLKKAKESDYILFLKGMYQCKVQPHYNAAINI